MDEYWTNTSSFNIQVQDNDTGVWETINVLHEKNDDKDGITRRANAVKLARTEEGSVRVYQGHYGNAHPAYNRTVWKNGHWLI
jgi:hypothetical protein